MSERPALDLPVGYVVVGRYCVLGVLGKGAFGSVYRVHDRELDREVALKVLHAQRAVRERDIARFEREAALLKRLQHPNVVEMLAYGPTTDGIPFIAFELIEGQSLSAVLRERGRLEVHEVRHIAVQVLRALGAAHELGIVHRDIKPQNILITGPTLDVKVLDFGIAKALGEEGEDLVTKLTATGAILGTPAYMAPEQVRGLTIRPSVDLYSLGAVMVELLTGKRLVAGKTPIDVLMEHVSKKPFVLAPEVKTSALGDSIARALEKDAAVRFVSAREMLGTLKMSKAVAAPVAGSRASRVAPTHRDPIPPTPPAAPVLTAAPALTTTIDQTKVGLEAPPAPRRTPVAARPAVTRKQPVRPSYEPPIRPSHEPHYEHYEPPPETLRDLPPSRWPWVFLTLIAVAGAAAGAWFWLLPQMHFGDDDEPVELIATEDDERADDDARSDDPGAPAPEPARDEVTPKPPPEPVVADPPTIDLGDPMVAVMTTTHIRARAKEAGYTDLGVFKRKHATFESRYVKLRSPKGTLPIIWLDTYRSFADRQKRQGKLARYHALGGGLKLLYGSNAQSDEVRTLIARMRKPPLLSSCNCPKGDLMCEMTCSRGSSKTKKKNRKAKKKPVPTAPR